MSETTRGKAIQLMGELNEELALHEHYKSVPILRDAALARAASIAEQLSPLLRQLRTEPTPGAPE